MTPAAATPSPVPASATPTPLSAAPTPCRTLYVRNLPEKPSKTALRALLHAAFSPHGKVVWIVAEKTVRLRGQAFVTFDDVAAATVAMRAMNAVDFLGRPMAVGYARGVSDRVVGPAGGSRKERMRARKAKTAMEAERAVEAEGSLPPAPELPVAPVLPPNRILFVENLPPVAVGHDGKKMGGADGLADLFARFSGFVEVRKVPGKDRIAFVEFAEENDAVVAMSGLQDQTMGDPPVAIKLTYAKK